MVDRVKSATMTKNQLLFFFVFQNFVTEPLSDRRFKPSFQKDTCLFRLYFFLINGPP